MQKLLNADEPKCQPKVCGVFSLVLIILEILFTVFIHFGDDHTDVCYGDSLLSWINCVLLFIFLCVYRTDRRESSPITVLFAVFVVADVLDLALGIACLFGESSLSGFPYIGTIADIIICALKLITAMMVYFDQDRLIVISEE